VIFRLLNFWLFTPIAAICYRLLTHDDAPGAQPSTPDRREPKAPLVRD